MSIVDGIQHLQEKKASFRDHVFANSDKWIFRGVRETLLKVKGKWGWDKRGENFTELKKRLHQEYTVSGSITSRELADYIKHGFIDGEYKELLYRTPPYLVQKSKAPKWMLRRRIYQ